ncbi:hypothetical protein ABZ721_33040 [Streptomyces sp. NPDC006733]|uniref:hypothetical protein n=1 Tax=Streptomyces sp. NPDC006733 TaxID=3155460 RepID=UPI0033E5E28E
MGSPRTPAALALAAAAVLLAGCQPEDGAGNASGGQVQQHGNQPGGACHYYVSKPYLSGRKIIAQVDIVCDKAVQQSKLTISLLKQDPGTRTFSSVSSQQFDSAPGLGARKISKLSSLCRPGVYRTSYQADILLLHATHWDTGSATNLNETVVTLNDCS